MRIEKFTCFQKCAYDNFSIFQECQILNCVQKGNLALCVYVYEYYLEVPFVVGICW